MTFGFLILTSPAYIFFFYQTFYDYEQFPYSFAGFYLYNSVAQKAIYTNSGINFFLYVMSGHKFRTDLVKLFKFCHRNKGDDLGSNPASVKTVSTAT